MKRKLFLAFIMVAVLALTLAFAVSADSIHNENTVDYSAKVTLNNGTEVNLFDNEGNALIWYLDANNELKSIRTDDQQVRWHTEHWDEVTSVGIKFEDGTVVNRGSFVVVNMMDDGVVKNSYTDSRAEKYMGKPVTNFKQLFQGCKKLEYVYLRLDTTGIFNSSFNGCSSLKYINVAELTLLHDSRDGQQFGGCTSLLAGQVLDLSKTQLISLWGGGTLNGVPIVGLKLPSTVTAIGDWAFQGNPTTYFMFPDNLIAMPSSTFKNCSNLQTVYLNKPLASIGENAFLSCGALEKICFVGSKAELEALIANTSATGNTAFFNVVGENNANLISYADYKKLEDKSGKYAIYDYSYCEAYNDGVHTPVTATNNCVGVCDTCGETVVNHTEKENLSVKFEYTNYGVAGTKTTLCLNEGCTYNVKEEIPALVVFAGYSTPEKGGAGIALGFTVNTDAINAYEKNTGKVIEFGAFAIAKKNLTENGVLNSSGEANQGAIKAEITQKEVKSFEFVITGFKTEAQKSALLAIGAYVISTVGEEVSISYIQSKAPLDGDNYSFISFDEIN